MPMPTALPDGLALIAYLEREDVRDVFISRKAVTGRSQIADSDKRRAFLSVWKFGA